VEATCGLAPFTFDAYSAGDRTVVLAGVSPVGWAGSRAPGADIAMMAQRVWVDTRPTSVLPLELARWLGLRPAWSLAVSPATLPLATLTARVDDPDTPVPEGADVRLQRAWRAAADLHGGPVVVHRIGGDELGDRHVADQSGALKPVIGESFPAERAVDALLTLDRAQATGKLVLEF